MNIQLFSVYKSSRASRVRNFYEHKINTISYNHVQRKAAHLKHWVFELKPNKANVRLATSYLRATLSKRAFIGV